MGCLLGRRPPAELGRCLTPGLLRANRKREPTVRAFWLAMRRNEIDMLHVCFACFPHRMDRRPPPPLGATGTAAAARVAGPLFSGPWQLAGDQSGLGDRPLADPSALRRRSSPQ